ncbi:(2Fe-2S)-binding protein [Streptomyces sp. Amel2xE9]|uniref:(2Fe-2S)-binding protein n=1 Tax=unclassified Streptomyces TaxID=2593676 RepID=UPI0003657DE2|nr:(2Fe-2S)-binding protein [Streptomyces sp. Amel2xE9]
MHLDARLAALAPLGGFFALRTGEPPHGPLPTLAQAYDHPPPAPDTDLAPGDSDPAPGPDFHPGPAPGPDHGPDRHPCPPPPHPLDTRVRRVAAGIGAREPRVAASVAHQALAARLWSVALGCAVRYGRLPDLDPRLLRWDPAGSAPEDLWLTEVRERPADPATLAGAVLHGHLEPLAAALRARHGPAAGLLRGNAASALAGAARQLARWARENGDPEAAGRTRALAADLLAHPLLAGAGTLTAHGTDLAFRRRSCCLYYRVPGGGVCGDCCFARVPRSSPRGPSG